MTYLSSLHEIQALIVEDMPVQQTTLRGQLTLLGITQVDVASNADDAYRFVKSRRYGLILCDFNLNQKTDGQQLFDHFTRTRDIRRSIIELGQDDARPDFGRSDHGG